jgi:hypothetical protein
MLARGVAILWVLLAIGFAPFGSARPTDPASPPAACCCADVAPGCGCCISGDDGGGQPLDEVSAAVRAGVPEPVASAVVGWVPAFERGMARAERPRPAISPPPSARSRVLLI